MTPEGKVKKRIRELLKKYPVYVVTPATGGFGMSGVPDLLICHRGRFIGVEVKAGSNKPTALQLDNLKKIIDAGGEALVVNELNINQLIEVLES